jgi:transcriptional regulator with XRE-family HTH domain
VTTAAHGTYASYKARGAGCCAPCRKAGSKYVTNRERQIAYGRWNPWTDAAPVRAHIEQLQASGLGWRRIADLAGVSRNTVNKIIYGRKGKPPSQRVRPETATKILAVVADLTTLGDHARVDATGTHRRLQALVAIGWSQTKLAARLGIDIGNFNTMLHQRDAVLVETARAVRDLYEQLWDTPPREATHGERQAASRSRNYAAARGWVKPMGWDDDAIDNPAAEPQSTGPAARVHLPQGEELLTLVRLGETDEALAMRFGVEVITVQQARYRAAKKEAVAA